MVARLYLLRLPPCIKKKSEPTHPEKEKVNENQQKATVEVQRESEEEEERCIILPEVAFAVVEIVSSLSLSLLGFLSPRLIRCYVI